MTTCVKKVKKLNRDNNEKGTEYVSFLSFITFHWITKLLNNVTREDIEFPKLRKRSYVKYYASELEENLRNIAVKKRNFNNFYERKDSDKEYRRNSKDMKKKEIYNVHYNNIVWSIFKTFKVPIISIIIFNIIHTLFVIIVGGSIDKYMLVLKGETVPFYPSFLKNLKVIFGLYIVVLFLLEFFFDSILNFYYYEFLVNLEISLIYLLYKINLYSYNYNLSNYYVHESTGNCSHKPEDGAKREHSSTAINEKFYETNKFHGIGDDNALNKKFYIINFFKRKSMKNGEDKIEKGDTSSVNIYNIMFSDAPSLVLFIGAIINIFNIFVKFYMSFYVFYVRMGPNAVKTGVLLSIVLYSTVILFEFLPSLFKSKYLKYRDKRIDNMHHVLKEFKLIKMFNWESFAFNYINYFREKEMKLCKIRLYLGTVGIFINAVSADIIEVVLFFLYIREKLDNKKEVTFSSIIMPLFVYKSLISSVSNFPNLMNHLIEGIVNIKRINKYVYEHLYYSDINNYFRYISENNDPYNEFFDSSNIEEVTQGSRHRICKYKLKSRWIKTFNFLFLNKRKKHVNVINKKILSGLKYNIDENEKKVCLQTTINFSNNDDVCLKKEKNSYGRNIIQEEETDLIIKFENCSFGIVENGYDNVSGKSILKNVNFNLKNNTLAIIIGNVGSGKTALFQSILGQLKLTHGCLYVKNFLCRMPILYVPQNSWLSIGNIRSMILFGNEYHSVLYRYTIVQSELLNDLYSFKNGDMRYISDEHNLSKGQKVRISLARALYHHYMHMYKISILCEKDIHINKSFNRKTKKDDFSNGNSGKNNEICRGIPFNENSVRNSIRKKNISYLYLLDDVFTSLDPFISKNIFYNLFCKEENKSFKDSCSFVISMNESTLSNFLISDIIDNMQFTVDIYELECGTLKYRGNILDYIKNKHINMKKENNFNKTKLNIDYTKLKLGDEREEDNKKNIKTGYTKCYMSLKEQNENYPFIGNNFSAMTPNKESVTSISWIENEYTINNNKKVDTDVKKMLHEKNHIRESKNMNNNLLQLKHNDCVNISGISGSEDESFFKGNIQLKTYAWYLSKVGHVVLLHIMIFMFISIFTDEIKFFILSMISMISRKDKKYSNEILQQQAKYLKLFVILPIISLIASFFCFMLIIYGTVASAVKVHTSVLKSILHAPMYMYYNSNLGNILNRFITDIYSLDSGFLKRFYKVIFLFFRLLLSVILLFCMMKDAIAIFPFIVLLIYFFVFKKYSEGCKEVQRGYLRCHSPLCNIYSSTILGKNIINLFEKNSYHLDIYERYIDTFRNYYLLKWAITIWASFYIRLIFLILTTYFIMHPHIFFNRIFNLYGEKNYEKIISTVGYCITFSSRLGIFTKILLCDYTFVEKEMCCVQRLEEFAKMTSERGSTNGKNKEQGQKHNEIKKKERKKEKGKKKEYKYLNEDSSEGTLLDPIHMDESKEKYGICLENVFVSYKKKILLDRNHSACCYVDEEPTLKNINIYALKNQKIGIVGKSGSGKSTILLSILGLINTNNGKITIEGKDIKTLQRKERNSIINVLPQSCFLFYHWDVRTFIDPYKNFTDEEIAEAFKLIGINLSMRDLNKYIYKEKKNGDNSDRKIKMKEKNNTLSNTIPLTNDCIRYLSLVRLFLNRHKCKLILIDEIPIFNPTNVYSHLNHFLIGNAKPFNYIITNYFTNNTVVIISHDTNTLSCCDFVYVLRKGEIAHCCSCKDIKTQSELASLLEKDN
ncbi:multidrug resistance-associated protein 1, putative [Plasmodium ovale wallikeri]|uniref:Multidrug resistance-associated protein 1, putative n=2 Tax=Plasmodium ovale TaxID=36330 RepID=A0A1A8YI23_PLAOA|nr:multidrug resistance-associated protein 1, putative [Plasmodium ovale wallikeri]SBT31189.1 multidrug resistance-associated protein 1, putative [Plasmodium ovale wallikeri]SBT75255.1 ABC transporter C family member 2, putative [Plasmodium ovale]